MRAAVITRPGGPGVLAVEDRPAPIAVRGQVLVRVHASALNRADLLQREGHYPAPPGWPPDIPGMEFAGEIAALGPDVDGWSVGERVFGVVGGGANAELVVTDAQCVARVPDSLSWIDAASVPEAFMTAYDAMVTQAGVSAGEIVLIHAVGSGVGLAATQLARAWHAVPYGTARTAEKIDRARALGLAAGLAVGASLDELRPTVERWTRGHGIDLTLDLLGGPYLSASIEVAALRGRIMLIGSVAGRNADVSIGSMLRKRLTLRGTVLRARNLEEKRVVTADFARDVAPLFASGVLRPTVDMVFPLDDIRAAHERLASNATFGKVVLRVD